MVFRQMSVGGRAYRGDPEMLPGHEGDHDTTKKAVPSDSSTAASSSSSPQVGDPLKADQVKLSNGVLQHFRDRVLSEDMTRAVNAQSGAGDEAAWARALNGFFTVLSLCHTVLTAVDPETGAIEYKAQSPDEAALVQAAADVGFIFRGREREILRLQTPFAEEIQSYELLNVLEFTSARKRMSVIVRKLTEEDSRLFLLCKGADNVIFERLKGGEDELKEVTGKHLDEFANEGLRTLTLAYKVIPGAHTFSRTIYVIHR
jgi:phospholipid-translocating ATPase